MSKLDTIQKLENLNEVHTNGNIGPGGAYHSYNIYTLKKNDEQQIVAQINFQKGPRNVEGNILGILDVDLLEIVRHRLKCFQQGEYKNMYNEMALSHVELALSYLNARVEDRIERKVLGTESK